MESKATNAIVPQPAATGSIVSFLIKAVIVVAAIIGVLTYVDSLARSRINELKTEVNSLAKDRIGELKETFGHVGGRQFWTSLEAELDRLADPKSDLSPEKKQKILGQIRTISNRWRPFLNEIVAPPSGNTIKP